MKKNRSGHQMSYPPSKTTPWDHQKKAWNMAKKHNGFYLALDMGCGKTKAAIDYANGFDAKTVLIVCPKAVIPTWPREFRIHSAAHYQVIGADFKKSWSAQKKALEISATMQRNTRAGVKTIVVLNYDIIYRPPIGPTRNKKNRIIDIGVLLKYNWDLLIVDEAHKIKSPSGKASWMCKTLGRKSKRRLLLSGTPMPHSPVDIYAQFRCLDDRIYGTSHARFKDKYCVMGGFDGKQIVAYKNEKDLHNRFHSHAIIVDKRDVLDLPKTTHIKRNVDLPSKLMKLYNELSEDFVVGLENGEITTENALTKLLRLAQLTSGFAQYDDDTSEVIDDTKLKELEDITSSLKTDEPLVIFCRFTKEIERAKDLMANMGRSVGELSGRHNDLEQFRDGKTDTLVVQVQAGSAGIDLTRAAYCVYFSKGFSLGDYEQSLARIDRPGQTRPVTYYHINASSTVDMQIDKALEKRKVVVDCILNDVDALIAAKTFIKKSRAA
jgi:SNF2 family DNA or RNA helicase